MTTAPRRTLTSSLHTSSDDPVPLARALIAQHRREEGHLARVDNASRSLDAMRALIRLVERMRRGDYGSSYDRGQAKRRPATLHARRRDTPGVMKARRRQKAARYRFETAVRASSASSSSPARRAPAARAPWTWSRTEGRGEFMRRASHERIAGTREIWTVLRQNSARERRGFFPHGDEIARPDESELHASKGMRRGRVIQ